VRQVVDEFVLHENLLSFAPTHSNSKFDNRLECLEV
jgi:hypothetical protein